MAAVEHEPSRACYQRGCDQDACAAENAAYQRHRDRMSRRPDEAWVPFVPAGAARAHVIELRNAGLGLAAVADLAGVAVGTLVRLMVPRDGRRTRRIRPETARAIMRVLPTSIPAGQPRRVLVDAGDTWQMIGDMLAHGHSKTELAGALGRRQLDLSHSRVTAGTAREVAALWRQLRGR